MTRWKWRKRVISSLLAEVYLGSYRLCQRIYRKKRYIARGIREEKGYNIGNYAFTANRCQSYHDRRVLLLCGQPNPDDQRHASTTGFWWRCCLPLCRTIGQSALVGPFIYGMLFFGETPSLVRIAGALTIVCGMLLQGFAKSGARRAGSNWLKLAFGAFLILAFAQSPVSASSCRSCPMSGLERACCISFDGSMAMLAAKLARLKRIEKNVYFS